MITSLLLSALALGISLLGKAVLMSDTHQSAGGLVSQPANITDEELDNVQTNQTFKPGNATSFLLKKTELEEELQNKTSAVFSEDDESFQDQETMFPHRQCMRELLIEYSYGYCDHNFHVEMERISREDWCLLESTIRPYNDLTVCLENLSEDVDCFFPNRDIQDFFLYIHSSYFHNCTEEEEALFEDAPPSLVVALSIIPMSFIPILVYLVVKKS